MDKPRTRILTGPDASALISLGKYHNDADPTYQRQADGSVLVVVNQNFHVWRDAVLGNGNSL